MKKVSSVVWQFFDRLEENKRCVAVLCKLCDSEYKYFGNTTNLRAHLIKKHPLQWEFRQNNLDGQKGLEEQPLIRAYEEDESANTERPPRRTKYVQSTLDKSIEALEHSEPENDPVDVDEDAATLNLVRQMHDSQRSDEEWLEEDYVQLDMFEPSRKKTYRKIKREIVTPPRRCSAFKFNSNKSATPQRTERVIIEDTRKDEYTVFGEYVANKLRKFKTPRTRGNIQQIITTILWQAEYGLYDEAASVKRVLMSSMQYGNEVEEPSTVQDSTDAQSGSQNFTETFSEVSQHQSEELDNNISSMER